LNELQFPYSTPVGVVILFITFFPGFQSGVIRIEAVRAFFADYAMPTIFSLH
jgi:hypothetical protein